MQIIELSKEEVISLFLQKNKIVNFGIYGYMLPYQNNYIKLFHKKLPNTFVTPTSTNLDREIKLLQTIETITDSHPLKKIKEKMIALQNTSSNNLIKAIITYNNYPIGVLLTKYQDYTPLLNIKNTLTNEEKITILKKIKDLLEELQNNNIYITNFNETNIIIRKSDHDIKIVNLDTSTTKVKSPEYKSNLDLIKKTIYQKYNILTKTFLN